MVGKVDSVSLIEQQIELEKRMTQMSINSYKKESNQPLGQTKSGTKLISLIIEDFSSKIRQYLEEYKSGKAVKSTVAAKLISKNQVETTAFITAKVIFNHINSKANVTGVYKAIGQALEDELKMCECKSENEKYYKTIQKDLNSRQAKANRKKYITTGVFAKRLDFHSDRWTVTEKFLAGVVLLNLFMESTGLIAYQDTYKGKKCIRTIVSTLTLDNFIRETDEKLEVMQPFFLPMVCPPKDWTGLFEGGYISPYLKRNKLIKNNDSDYIKKIKDSIPDRVYMAVNHIQATSWKINKNILNVVQELWKIGKPIAELPNREDTPLIPFPYPEKDKDSGYTEEEAENVKKWKRAVYEIHKSNVKERSLRLLTAQILQIAEQFQNFGKIWFPYQMDFRGRIYPIPVLLQPQGSDLAKGLLEFGEGKPVNNKTSEKWFRVHGANMFGFDKESYEKRVLWTYENHDNILSFAENPLEDLRWAEADKPFQFLAWCFEFSSFIKTGNDFKSYIPIQLDGTCNGLQHYSALLQDDISGAAVNLTDTEKPSDIYEKVADKLKEKLVNDRTNKELAEKWLKLGINRKLTKRPVMVLPYGGTQLSCREYITEYLTDNFSNTYLWDFFEKGNNPQDCVYKVSVYLSKLLWESIKETLRSAIVGMSFLKSVARLARGKPIEWLTPLGLLIRQGYKSRKNHIIRTELFGTVKSINVKTDDSKLDGMKQLNGICPNYIHSLDAACLMIYLNKCKKAGINSIMSVHDCYGVLAADTEISARLLREAFVEIYERPLLDDFVYDVSESVQTKEELPKQPNKGLLDVKEVLKSNYFFN